MHKPPGLLKSSVRTPCAVIRAIRLDGGQAAVRIGSASPSPFGLLVTASPTAQAAPPA
jgi:hypothetical protein